MQQPDPGLPGGAFAHLDASTDPIGASAMHMQAGRLHNALSPHLPPLAPPPNSQQSRPPMLASYSTSQALRPIHDGQHQYQQIQGPPMQFHPPSQNYHAPMPQQDTRTQLFVSNLPFRARWQDLVRLSIRHHCKYEKRSPQILGRRMQKDLMRKCGTVLRADVALSPTDGRSRGFGVVLFAKAEDATKAIAMYHGYTWQTRVLDVRVDAQDPTGALALAEANRQQAVQNQQKLLEQRARSSPIPPAPPALVGLPYGSMLVPVPGSLGQTFLAAGPSNTQPAARAPSAAPDSSPSSYLTLPGTTRSSPHETTARQSPSPTPFPSAPATSASSPASVLATPLDLSPSAGPNESPFTGDGKSAHSPQVSRFPLAQHSGPSYGDRSLQYEQVQQPHSSGAAHGRAQDMPPQLQHALALVPPPPPPPGPIQLQMQPPPSHQQQAMLMPMMSIHPMGYAVPGGLVSYYAPQQGGPARPGSAPPHMHGNGNGHVMGMGMGMGPGPGAGSGGPGYTNRHLFVGNLPFNCQWQELKDLMRGAGNVLRADIAQGPDGRSRGFGSVLFATSQDAERAVQLFNGHEFNGRTLKVHFDKFAGAAVNNSQHYQSGSAPPAHYGGPHGPPPPPPPPLYGQRQQQNLQAQYGLPVSIPYRPQTLEHLVSEPSHTNSSPYSEYARSADGRQDAASRPGTAVARPHSSGEHSASSPSSASVRQQEQQPQDGDAESTSVMALIKASLADASQGITAPAAAIPSSPAPSFARGHSNPAAPSRIAMPPPLPFSLASLGHQHPSVASQPHSAGGVGSPFSPMRTAGLPPMTPSMPAFTFGGAGAFAAQPTPPLLPHGMFSPGIGPFSPGTHAGAGAGGGAASPFFGPGGVWGHTTAPSGAGPQTPGLGGFNPMFPPYPYTPGHHLSHQQPQASYHQHQYGGQPLQHAVAEIPEAEQESEAVESAVTGRDSMHATGEDSTFGELSPGKTFHPDEPSFFPPVVAPRLDESAAPSIEVPTTSASAPPLPPIHGLNDVGGIGGRPKSDGAVGPLERALESLTVIGDEGAAHGSGQGTRSLHSSPRTAAPPTPSSAGSVLAPKAIHPARSLAPPSPLPAVGWAEVSPPPPLEKELTPPALDAPRRASVDSGLSGTALGADASNAALGTSIWG